MVKKFDLISPVYEKAEIQMVKNESEFKRLLNAFRMSFARALDPVHPQHISGEEYLNRYELTIDHFTISIDHKLPDVAQRQIQKINEKFELGMSYLNDAVLAYQSGLIDSDNYLPRNRLWGKNSKELSSLIDQFSLYCRTDLNELTKGIRSRSRLSAIRRLKLEPRKKQQD